MKHYTSDEKPTQPGCYVKLDKCKNKDIITNKWMAENQQQTGYEKNKCLIQRKKDWDKECGTTNTEMHYVATDTIPTNPGCYVNVDKCKQNTVITHNKWMKDSWGEVNMASGIDNKVCVKDRKKHWDDWCGTTNTKMHFN